MSSSRTAWRTTSADLAAAAAAGSDLRAAAARSAVAAVGYLVRAQHPAGSWTDFWLPVGTSDAWVTAYVGLALAAAGGSSLPAGAARAAAAAARRAAGWLLAHQRPYAGWGYNADVPVDADSTAHAVSLLARLGMDVPRGALRLLHRHKVPGEGYRTYAWSDPEHQWGRPCSDVTAAVLRALHDAGELHGAGMREAWQQMLAGAQDNNGWWRGYWWPAPAYTTGLALEVWDAAGRPTLRASPGAGEPITSAFDLAWTVHALALLGLLPGATPLAGQLVATQEYDGSWRDAPILHAPPSHPGTGGARGPIVVRDARRLFTTASAVRALITAWPAFAVLPRVPQRQDMARLAGFASRRSPAPRSSLGRRLDELIGLAASAAGLGTATGQARRLFADLTRESLRSPCPWPAHQISSLADGIPLEFSVTVGNDATRALRYAVDVGDPVLSPYDRARSAVAAVARVALSLGYERAWERIVPAINRLIAPDLPVPDGLRFWVWSGIDHAAPAAGQPAPPPGLKIYMNLLNRELGGTRGRLEAALTASAIPVPRSLGQVLDWLDAAGFVHELGFGIGPNGTIACKVYYELVGWRRILVQRILERAGLPLRPEALCPEIPGILSESLAKKARAGIALRLAPATGEIQDATIAAAFPPPLLRREDIVRRVEAWISAQDWDVRPYRALVRVLLAEREAQAAASHRLHSLFTRSLSRGGAWSTIYLRPFLSTNQ